MMTKMKLVVATAVMFVMVSFSSLSFGAENSKAKELAGKVKAEVAELKCDLKVMLCELKCKKDADCKTKCRENSSCKVG